MSILALALAACGGLNPPNTVDLSMESPSPFARADADAGTRVVAIGGEQASATPDPISQMTPAIVLEPPEAVPSATPTPPTVGLPDAEIVFYFPGPNSQVTSPIRVVGYGGPSYDNQVQLRLIGEDGRVIAERSLTLLSFPGNAGRFVADVAFDIPGVAEAARLEASTFDRDDRLMDQLASVNLLLLSEGDRQIHPGMEGPQKLAILSPVSGANIEGGMLRIEGAGWIDSDRPLTLHVLDSNGNALVTTQVELQAPQVGVLGTFETDIPFTVETPTRVRIGIFEQGVEIAGMVHYSSVVVTLRP